MPRHPQALRSAPLAGAPAGAAEASQDACYLALKARDARFDGQFFTGVTSTGIYCRPVCKVRTPRRENCRFFTLAAQAEAAGFRPCLRCRPELAPEGDSTCHAVWSTQDASAILARQAAELLRSAALDSAGIADMAQLAQRLGVSARHVRRIFAAHWGISPLQYLQTRRLLRAKQLLTDSRLSVAAIAQLSGFGSLRSFNTAFLHHYRLQPSALRKQGSGTQTGHAPRQEAAPGTITLHASYRPPYDVQAMLAFLDQRSIAGLEQVDTHTLYWTRTLRIPCAAPRAIFDADAVSPESIPSSTAVGWVQARFVPAQCRVTLLISESLAPVLPTVWERLRAALDLDADPAAINACLGASFPGTEGLRLPGTVDGFELAVRAVLGQQITVAAARTLVTRLVHAMGEPVLTPHAGLSHLFPSPQTLAQVPPQTLGALGIVRQRQAALIALAQAVADGRLVLQPTARPHATMDALLALPGIGPWTAHYIAMRALRWTDAFPAGDVALQKALGVRDAVHPARAAEQASQAWRPWRAYAVIRAWSGAKSPAPAPAARPAP